MSNSGKYDEAHPLDYKQILADNEELTLALCRIYFQDFVCNGFRFPHVCRRMLRKALRGAVPPELVGGLFAPKRGPASDDLE